MHLVSWLQLTFPSLVREMQRCSHHYDHEHLNPYHLEGDIFTHTMMVHNLSQLYETDKLIKYSTLMHDIGKPMSAEMVHERQKKRFIGHEGASTFIAVELLNKLPELSDVEKITILKLISSHGDLFHYIMKDQTIREEEVLKRFKHDASFLRLLTQQVMCDSLGRFIDAETVHDHDVDFIKELPKHFAPIIHRLNDEVPARTKDKQITLLVGPPLSGKSTWISKNLKDDEILLSRDAILLEQNPGMTYGKAWHNSDQNEIDKIFNARFAEARKSGKDIVIDMTNMGRKSRHRILSQINPSHYHKKAIVFFTSLNEMISRNDIRSQTEGKYIGFGVLSRFVKSFTLPSYDEFDEIEYYFNDKIHQLKDV